MPLGSEDEKTIKSLVVNWIAGQPFSNVLLLAIFVSIGWIGHYSMTTAIPLHLQQIQKGYESLTESHREERERTLQLYDRWMNRSSVTNTNDSKVADGNSP